MLPKVRKKKNAIRAKDRKRKQEQRDVARLERLPVEDVDSTPGPMRQSVYNLTREFRVSAARLNVTSSEYARSTMNLLNPRTPEKRAAIRVEQKSHPARTLFQEDFIPSLRVEEELGITLEDDPMLGPSQQGEETLPKPPHVNIQLFCTRYTVSRMLPQARYTTKHGPARVMSTTIRVFLEENGEETVGLTLFQILRPKNVRLLGSVPLDSCLCVYCTNIRLKLQALNSVLGSTSLPNETDLFGFITCPYEGRWPLKACIDGVCQACRDIFHTVNLKWQQRERNSAGKVEPVQKEGVVRVLLDELDRDLSEPSKGTFFLTHIFTAFWQYKQFKMCKTNPDEGEVIMVQDFGENRKAAYSAEIKSAHFGKSQITVHPVVCFYRLGEDVIRESHVFLSDDIQHDHHAVRAFTLRSLELLQPKVCIKKVTMWSDGAASQYKGRGTFYNLSVMSELDVQRCYFGSEHGKGEADH